MNELQELFSVSIPQSVENLMLPDPALLDHYRDAEKRVFWLEGDVCNKTLELAKAIMRCNQEDRGVEPEDRKPIRIFIDTYGGDVQIMWTLVNVIKISKTPVHTIVFCNAMSAGAHILAAGHKRFAMPGATILVHSGSVEFGGDVEKVESAKKYFDNLGKQANAQFLEDTQVLPKDLKRKGAIDWYMSAEEALKQGLIDAIVTDFEEVM